MAKLRASYTFTGYVPDRGADALPTTYRGTFNAPIGLTQGDADTIISAAGGFLVKWNGVDIPGSPANPPCPEGNNFKPRKLVFLMSNGVSVSVPSISNDPGSLIALAQLVNGILNGISPVLCIKLVGERWKNIMAQLGQANKTPIAGVDPRGFTYSGTFAYTSDAGPATVNKSFKMDSNIDGAAPAYLGTTFAPPAGAPDYCPGTDRRDTRRYLVNALITRDGAPRIISTQVPVATAVPADVRALGTALAQLGAVACVGYKGEDYDRFHLVVP